MSNPLQQLDAELSGLLASLSPAERRALASDIVKTLRGSQQKRIAAQLNPDGTAFAARKPQLRAKKGAIRRQMFRKLRTARFLKTEATSNGAVVGFVGQVERIARVHQLGLRDRVRPGGPETQYPVRELLGFSEDDVETIHEMVLSHLAK